MSSLNVRSDFKIAVVNLPDFIKITPGGVKIAVKVQPRSSANQIMGPTGKELRIKLMAPPVESAANQSLILFLAEAVDCPRGRVKLVGGLKSRNKLVCITDVPLEQILRALSAQL